FVASFNCSTEDPNFEILFANFQILPIIPITPAIITRSISIIIHSFHYFLFIYLFAGFGSEVLLFPVTFKYGLGFNCERYPAKFPVVSTSTCKWILYMPFGVFPMVPICCPAFTLSPTFTVFELLTRCIYIECLSSVECLILITK